jgi:hypothetical protein
VSIWLALGLEGALFLALIWWIAYRK